MNAPPAKRTTRDYAKKLFHNVYNYTLLGGVTAAAVLTKQWWLLGVGVGVESLWMLYAPDLAFLRRHVDGVFEREERQAFEQRRQQMMQQLSPEDRMRCRELVLKQQSIERLASDNPTFSGELMRGELGKLERLVDSFIEMSYSTYRFREHLERAEVGDIERQARQYEREAKNAKEHARELALKNLAVVERRLEHLREIHDYLDRSSGQLELIENTLGLLADQIVSMRSPTELAHQLDELIDGVDAVRETAREADKLLVSEAR